MFLLAFLRQAQNPSWFTWKRSRVLTTFSASSVCSWEAWSPSWGSPLSFDLWPLCPGSKPSRVVFRGDGGTRWFEAASSKCFHMLPLVRLWVWTCENRICGKPESSRNSSTLLYRRSVCLLYSRFKKKPLKLLLRFEENNKTNQLNYQLRNNLKTITSKHESTIYLEKLNEVNNTTLEESG